MVSETKQLKDFFKHINNVEELLNNKEAMIFLDYDGTLTPIVDTPDLAILSDETHDVINKLADHYKVSIVSGRATDDVRSKVNIDGIYYAGSHGFEIVDPTGHTEVNKDAVNIKKVITGVYQELCEKLKHVKGALVENVTYTISAHYRLVSDENFSKVSEAVDDVLIKHNNLKKIDGKKVFEIRPKFDWDKGKAVEFILDALKFDADKNIVVYIGDDTTDEDAFKSLEGKGFGILVADEPRNSSATFIIANTDDVRKILEYFLERKKL